MTFKWTDWKFNGDSLQLSYQSSRGLVMEGITNLRSLGGYRNKNQQVIKDGLIYRSGQLDQLTPAQTHI